MGTSDRFSVEDVAAQVRGVNAFLAALGKLWPQADAAELAEKVQALEASPLAQELLCLVLSDRKIRV